MIDGTVSYAYSWIFRLPSALWMMVANAKHGNNEPGQPPEIVLPPSRTKLTDLATHRHTGTAGKIKTPIESSQLV